MEFSVIDEPAFYAAAVPALLLIGISKGGFGGGLGVLGVPLLSLSVPPPRAAAILLPILCLMDLFALLEYRSAFSRSHVLRLLPPAMLGIALGALVFGALSERWIRGAVGALALLFVAQRLLEAWRREPAPAPRPLSTLAAALWGVLAGFTSTLAHAGGPPLSIALLPQRLAPRVFVGTTVVLFSAINYAKLVPYWWLGQLRLENLATSLLLAPLAPLGVRAGRWLHGRIDTALFYRIAYALLAIMGLKLFWDGVLG
jgi:uncharacterized protein